MNITAYHNSQLNKYRHPFGAVRCESTVTLKISVEGNVDCVNLRLWYDNCEHIYQMANSGGLYSIDISMPDRLMLVWYMFLIIKDGQIFYYGKGDHLSPEGMLYDCQPQSFQITVYGKDFRVPSWFSDTVMYQIFVDRFYNGNENGYVYKKRPEYHIHSDWNSPVPYDRQHYNSEFARNDFYGGNLKGIIEKLDYLSDLGISVIYLNPIFDAYSNHKYDTGDYMKIDAMFGDEDIFKELCDKAKEKGISVILDGVFSHTGIDSKYFNKFGSYDSVGAYQSKNSPYYDWYKFDCYPDKYSCWWGITTLPNVNEMTNSFREFILNGEESVVKHWIRQGAKGWRIDVADELPDEFIKEMRTAVKYADSDSILIGEVWEDASNKISYDTQREYLLGQELDSVMNYPFKDGLAGFIMGWHSGEHFNKIIMSLYENYPTPCFYSLMNLIDSHDVIRAKTLFGNPPDLPMEKKAEYRLPYEKEILANKRLRLAVLCQMTFPGVPCIYYGDEIGMQGFADPFNRSSFCWDNIDMQMLQWYRKLIYIRNNFAPLRTGEYIPIIATDDILCYKREINCGFDALGRKVENGTAYVFLNRSEYSNHQVSFDPGQKNRLYNPIDNEIIKANQENIKVCIPPVSGILYISENLID